MAFTYQSGEEIRKGDRVLLHGEPGEIQLVAVRLTGDPELDWYVTECGGGVMVVEPKAFGRLFLTKIDEDLAFVSRAGDAAT